MYQVTLILMLLQQRCVFLVIAWLMSKTRLCIPLMQVPLRLPHQLLCYITFSIFCLTGTWSGLHIEHSIANTRAIEAVMGRLAEILPTILTRRERSGKIFRPLTAGAITFIAGLLQMAVIALIARPLNDALHLVQSIKYGTSQLLGCGEITLQASRDQHCLLLAGEDSAGLWLVKSNGGACGMIRVDKRLRLRFGDACGIQVACKANRLPVSPCVCR